MLPPFLISPGNVLPIPGNISTIVFHAGAIYDTKQLLHCALPGEELLWLYILRHTEDMKAAHWHEALQNCKTSYLD